MTPVGKVADVDQVYGGVPPVALRTIGAISSATVTSTLGSLVADSSPLPASSYPLGVPLVLAAGPVQESSIWRCSDCPAGVALPSVTPMSVEVTPAAGPLVGVSVPS